MRVGKKSGATNWTKSVDNWTKSSGLLPPDSLVATQTLRIPMCVIESNVLNSKLVCDPNCSDLSESRARWACEQFAVVMTTKSPCTPTYDQSARSDRACMQT